MHTRRSWLPWTLIVGLAIVAVVTGALSAASTSSTADDTSNLPIPVAPFTGFGGYVFYGNTTSISAQWVVPAILDDRHPESAATWIGAMSSLTPAFVQVGITEQRFSSAPPRYEAFWSDTALHFEAQPIETVAANDRMSAKMTETSKGWLLDIADLTQNWSRSFPSHYNAPGPYTEGEWTQEDPPPSLVTAHDLAYPTTAVVQFTDVKVNGTVPTLPFVDGQALSGFGGVYLVPTAFTDDTFSLPPAQGAARQYLIGAARYDAVIAAIDAEAGPSPTAPSDAQRRREIAQLVDAQKTFDSYLLLESWPATAVTDIDRFVRFSDDVIGDYRKVEAVNFKLTPALTHQFLSDSTQFHTTVDATRAQLGLPPT